MVLSKKEESAEEIAHQRKVLESAKMELEWDRKERDSRRDLEGEETEARRSNPEESQARRYNPQTGVGADVERGVFSSSHLDTGYGLAFCLSIINSFLLIEFLLK